MPGVALLAAGAAVSAAATTQNDNDCDVKCTVGTFGIVGLAIAFLALSFYARTGSALALHGVRNHKMVLMIPFTWTTAILDILWIFSGPAIYSGVYIALEVEEAFVEHHTENGAHAIRASIAISSTLALDLLCIMARCLVNAVKIIHRKRQKSGDLTPVDAVELPDVAASTPSLLPIAAAFMAQNASSDDSSITFTTSPDTTRWNTSQAGSTQYNKATVTNAHSTSA
ncbi:hypothetical protein Slin14017_G050130 [Septoria linicola]|nr:hypothetical protein Slin14017_G050130 [Septoria linicola]